MFRLFSRPATAAALILALLLAAAPCTAGLLQDGEQALQKGDRESAQRLFTEVFEAGDPAGAFGLGVLYFEGREQGDMEQAAHWFRVAAQASGTPKKGWGPGCTGFHWPPVWLGQSRTSSSVPPRSRGRCL